jgi:hypothetical protein
LTEEYLKQVLAQESRYASNSTVSQAFGTLKALYKSETTNLPDCNEANTESRFIEPVLTRVLGFDGRAKDHRQHTTIADTSIQPDMVLFSQPEDYASAVRLRQTQPASYFNKALVVEESKYWERPLLTRPGESGRELRKDQSEFTHRQQKAPFEQILSYLEKSGVSWGILTNGAQWMLVPREQRERARTYILFNLRQVIETEDSEGFALFYYLFHRDAFENWQTQKCRLDQIRAQNLQRQAKLEAGLHARVYPALVAIAQGFYEALRSRARKPSKDDLYNVYHASLYLLYRLLFLFYAESRDLLPIGQDNYKPTNIRERCRQAPIHYSPRGRKVEVSFGNPSANFNKTTHSIWNLLSELFGFVERGNGSWGLPPYNGDLFKQRNWPEGADDLSISDYYLGIAIRLLGFRYEAGNEHTVDYSNLGVRQLGSIYEHLLLFSEPDVASSDSSVEWPIREPADNGGTAKVTVTVKIPVCSLYFDLAPTARKSTGTYYTPDYIVRYIVDNTLGPLMEAREKQFAEVLRKITEKNEELKRARSPATLQTIRQMEMRELERRAVDALLDVKVCDPAMGSGHFLVDACEYIAKRIKETMEKYPDNPISKKIDQLRKAIQENAKQKGYQLNEEYLSDERLLQRLILKRCIYGVDLNPLAVEMAKLSLWLHFFTVGAPVSFLDHHLKCGNSLIGSRFQDVRSVLPFGPLDQLMTKTMNSMKTISDLTDATIEEISESVRIYEAAEEIKKPARRLFDAWVAEDFGARGSRAIFMSATLSLTDLEGDDENRLSDDIRKALAIGRARRFFHWELEFPEVFMGPQTRAGRGFDAAVGNPPWGVGFDLMEQDYYSNRFKTGKCREVESYALLTEQAIGHLRYGGSMGYITPDTGLRKANLLYWRDVLLNATAIQQLVETGPLFTDVPDTWCLVTIAKRSRSVSEDHKIRHRQISRFVVSPEQRMALFAAAKFSRDSVVSQSYWASRARRVIGYLSSEHEQSIITKVENTSVGLGKLKDLFSISRGEEGSKFRLRSSPSARWRLVLPEHVERYSVEEGVPIRSPSLTRTKVDTLYSHPKIWVIRIQKLRWKQRLVAGYDERTNSSAMKTLQGVFSVPENDHGLKYVCALICSKLMNYWCCDYLVDDMNQSYLENLPIRRIEFTTAVSERLISMEKGRELYERCISKADCGPVLDFVLRQLNRKPERADVVHELLAFLAEKMTAMNKQKTDEVKGFLTWLEGNITGDIEALTNKTKIKAYHKHSFNDLVSVLRQNAAKFATDVPGRRVQERIARQFNTSIGKLNPLKARIAATDRLIDLIIYRLYGLTDEEIALVESNTVEVP